MEKKLEGNETFLNVQELINLWSHLDSTHMEKEKLLYPASFLLVSAVFAISDKITSIVPLICVALTSILMHIYLIMVGKKYTSYQDEIFNQIHHLQTGGNPDDITNQFRRIFVPEDSNYGETPQRNLKTGIPSIRKLRVVSLGILISIWLLIVVFSGKPLYPNQKSKVPIAELPQRNPKELPKRSSVPVAKTAHP